MADHLNAVATTPVLYRVPLGRFVNSPRTNFELGMAPATEAEGEAPGVGDLDPSYLAPRLGPALEVGRI